MKRTRAAENKTISLAILFLLSQMSSACGGDYADEYLHNGDSIAAGRTVAVRAPVSFSLVSCTSDPSDECTAELKAAVLLPPQVDYAAGAEVVTGLGDLLFGEGEVNRLETQTCPGGSTLIKYRVPERTVDTGDDEDRSIAADIIDDILDGAVQEFRFRISARNTGRGLGIWFSDNAAARTTGELCRMSESEPFVRFSIVP